MWFRPLVLTRLKAEGISTLGELVAFYNRRGGSWWRSVPRIGAGWAQHIVARLRQHDEAIGVDDDGLADPLVASEVVLVDEARGTLAPLERMAIGSALSGAAVANRCAAFAFIKARNDLEAVHAYITAYREQPKTSLLTQKSRSAFSSGRAPFGVSRCVHCRPTTVKRRIPSSCPPGLSLAHVHWPTG
ncbi:phage integrase family protein [Paraburkholderia elongata]|uniref:Uncharacterized protein n=1 Tax=Paraburkholderia elongata TaxID=2675747 RepID=A0A972NS12_9BURK|nr:hypothetical protein [Paraburkholderia elongata]